MSKAFIDDVLVEKIQPRRSLPNVPLASRKLTEITRVSDKQVDRPLGFVRMVSQFGYCVPGHLASVRRAETDGALTKARVKILRVEVINCDTVDLRLNVTRFDKLLNPGRRDVFRGYEMTTSDHIAHGAFRQQKLLF